MPAPVRPQVAPCLHEHYTRTQIETHFAQFKLFIAEAGRSDLREATRRSGRRGRWRSSLQGVAQRAALLTPPSQSIVSRGSQRQWLTATHASLPSQPSRNSAGKKVVQNSLQEITEDKIDKKTMFIEGRCSGYTSFIQVISIRAWQDVRW